MTRRVRRQEIREGGGEEDKRRRGGGSRSRWWKIFLTLRVMCFEGDAPSSTCDLVSRP